MIVKTDCGTDGSSAALVIGDILKASRSRREGGAAIITNHYPAAVCSGAATLIRMLFVMLARACQG